MQTRVKVLVVDDHSMAREGVRELLKEDSAFVIVGEASSGKEGLELVRLLQPDLILMDIRMAGMDGLETTKRIKMVYPWIKIVMMTVSDDISDLFEAVKKGAQGYLLKNLQPGTWLSYLRAIVSDETPMSKELASMVLKEFQAYPADYSAVSPLTNREREILSCVAKGLINKKIAEELTISEHTVKNHLKNILAKLQLANRVQLTRYAYEQGLIDRDVLPPNRHRF